MIIGFVVSVKLGLDMLDPAGGGKKATFEVTEEDVEVRVAHRKHPRLRSLGKNVLANRYRMLYFISACTNAVLYEA